MTVKVGCLEYLEALIAGCLGGSVLKFDLAGAVKKNMGDFRFWIESDSRWVSLCFRSVYISSCGTISKVV